LRNSILDIRPVSGALGAEIHGIDLERPLEERACAEIRNALNEYGVIFFRDQNISPAAHLAFGKRFGDIWASRNMGKVAGHPQVVELRREPDDTHEHGGNWHTDQVYTEVPLLGSILLAREVPASGGDTMFANMCAAYETLSPGLKKTLGGLRAVHSVGKRIKAVGIAAPRADAQALNADEQARSAVHPVVTRHPETGRKVLYVNPTYTERFEGWTIEESAPLLDYLYRHGSRPENVCRFHWQAGSIAFWDNRSTWHFAVQDYGGLRRVMHRVSIAGTAPVAA
jgi:taurine dioxygenase